MTHLNIISPESILPSHYLGQGIDLGEQRIDFLVSQGFPNDQRATLVQGSFLIALKTNIYQHVIGYPSPENLNTRKTDLTRLRRPTQTDARRTSSPRAVCNRKRPSYCGLTFTNALLKHSASCANCFRLRPPNPNMSPGY